MSRTSAAAAVVVTYRATGRVSGAPGDEADWVPPARLGRKPPETMRAAPSMPTSTPPAWPYAAGRPVWRVAAGEVIEGVRDAPCVRTLTGTRP
jgi:hypothetical protein